MTDREAVIWIVGDLCAFFEGRSGVRDDLLKLQRLLDNAEPAAPTDDLLAHTHLRCSKCKGYYRPGSSHDCAPTVTREQALVLRVAVEAVLDREDFPIPERPEMPAFFRAVADALEGE